MLRSRSLASMSAWRYLVFGVLAVALVLGSDGVAVGGVSGEDGATGDRGWDTVGNADSSRVTWNGLNWDIVGYNTPDAQHGIVGPEGTVTLLLDETSYRRSMRTVFTTATPWNVYGGSELQARMVSLWTGFADKAEVTPRTLTGGSAISSALEGFDGSSVSGPTVPDQRLWPLSVNEASQLKASVRSCGDVWWLRTPGFATGTDDRLAGNVAWVDNDGDIYGDGRELPADTPLGARPALYLGLDAPVFRSMASHMASGVLRIGAYDATVRATDANGRTWDVVGVNDGSTSRGIQTPAGHATVLLSYGSVKKFQGLNESSFDTILPATNAYMHSNVQQALSRAYDELSSEDQYRGRVLARTLAGGSGAYGTSTYQPDNVLGVSAADQHLWPLSVTEACALFNQQRVYGVHSYGYNGWYLRTPGEGTDWVACVDTDGGIGLNKGSYVWNSAAIRPAMYLSLSSSVFAGLPSGWAERVGMAVGGGQTLVDGVISKASVARTPNTSSAAYVRRLGVAKFTLSAVIKGRGSKPVRSHYVYLQTSRNGTSWSSTYRIKTSLTGRASKAFRVSSSRVRYYRWYVPAKSGECLSTYSKTTRVTVK